LRILKGQAGNKRQHSALQQRQRQSSILHPTPGCAPAQASGQTNENENEEEQLARHTPAAAQKESSLPGGRTCCPPCRDGQRYM